MKIINIIEIKDSRVKVYNFVADTEFTKAYEVFSKIVDDIRRETEINYGLFAAPPFSSLSPESYLKATLDRSESYFVKSLSVEHQVVILYSNLNTDDKI